MTFIGIGEWPARRASLTPDAVALADLATGRHFNYRTWNCRVRALAAVLSECFGVGTQDRVVIMAANSAEYLDAFFATALLGATFVPLNWRLTTRELAGILADCKPRLVLHDAAFAIAARAALEATPRGESQLFDLSGHPGADSVLADHIRPFDSVAGEEIALILYTSGTTGVPKGAMLSHRMITWNAVNTQISWGLRENDSTPTFAPFFHAGGLNVLTTPLIHCGGKVVLVPSSDPGQVMQAIAQERTTIVFAVPTVFQKIMEHPDFAQADFSAVRFCVTGGSSCPLPVIHRFAERGITFRQGYGLTEVGVNCFSLAPEDAVRKAGSVGRPVFHSRARLVDEDDRDVAPGAVGELVLAGPHVCSGYWQRPEATEEAYRQGWWHTGDLAHCDEEGFFFITGRKKDMFISGGENVYPVEIESVLERHPAVAEVAIIAEPDPTWGERGIAVVVLRESVPATEQDIIAYCDGRLARFKIPKRVVFTNYLPRNAMGKVVKAELREQFIDQAQPKAK
ncbi:MAG: acyl-CoA synthetase [Ktedonobacterales bacterium]